MARQMTVAQAKRLQQMMQEYAGEPVTVEDVGGTTYVFGSELACLRIFAKHNVNGRCPSFSVHIGFSETLDKWYFTMEEGGWPRDKWEDIGRRHGWLKTS